MMCFTSPTPVTLTVNEADIRAIPDLQLLATSPEAGVFAVKSEDNRRFFIMGHPEYDPETLNLEYQRDINAGKKESPSLPTISQTMTPPSRRWSPGAVQGSCCTTTG